MTSLEFQEVSFLAQSEFLSHKILKDRLLSDDTIGKQTSLDGFHLTNSHRTSTTIHQVKSLTTPSCIQDHRQETYPLVQFCPYCGTQSHQKAAVTPLFSGWFNNSDYWNKWTLPPSHMWQDPKRWKPVLPMPWVLTLKPWKLESATPILIPHKSCPFSMTRRENALLQLASAATALQ